MVMGTVTGAPTGTGTVTPERMSDISASNLINNIGMYNKRFLSTRALFFILNLTLRIQLTQIW